ncbi:MAG: hypothetical protein KDA28_01710, partial [Phycisphaerales bacterium]|nr:hypothetical protein [Phycisphaerales bacterium]
MLALLAMLAPACRDPPTRSDDPEAEEEPDPRIFFARRTFVPPADIDEFLEAGRRHGLLQLHEIPRTLDAIEDLGIQVHGVQHNNAYYVTLPEGMTREDLRDIGARALFSMEPLDRISPRLVPIGVEESPEPGELRVVLDFVEDTPTDTIMAALQASEATLLDLDLLRGRATIQIPGPSLLVLAREPWLWWMDTAPGPLVPDMDVVTERLGADEVQPPPWGDALLATGLTGSGVTVGLWEIPIGQSAAGVLDSHPDLLGRVAFGPDQLTLPSRHATQVAGVLAGDGTASAQEGGAPFGWSGVAPQAQLVSWDAIDSPAEMVTSLASFGTSITSHSFGLIIDSEIECGGAGAYDVTDASYDDVVRSSN